MRALLCGLDDAASAGSRWAPAPSGRPHGCVPCPALPCGVRWKGWGDGVKERRLHAPCPCPRPSHAQSSLPGLALPTVWHIFRSACFVGCICCLPPPLPSSPIRQHRAPRCAPTTRPSPPAPRCPASRARPSHLLPPPTLRQRRLLQGATNAHSTPHHTTPHHTTPHHTTPHHNTTTPHHTTPHHTTPHHTTPHHTTPQHNTTPTMR